MVKRSRLVGYFLHFHHHISIFFFSILLDTVVCGPIECPLNSTHMCFFTSMLKKDDVNGTYITSCGTCLNIDGNFEIFKCSFSKAFNLVLDFLQFCIFFLFSFPSPNLCEMKLFEKKN